MDEDIKKRILQTGKSILILFGIGMLYVFLITFTGFRIPCMFNELTGLYCPGCGVSRLCLSILRLDFKTAYRCNQMIFLSAPVLVGIAGILVYRYIRYGCAKADSVMNGILCFFIFAFVIFGIIRNLPGMEILTPPVI